MSESEKTDTIAPVTVAPTASARSGAVDEKTADDANPLQVFHRQEGAVDFRTVEWLQASVIFLKIIFATGVLSIPSALYTLGALPGAINVIAWQLLNTYCAVVQGSFRSRHPHCHSIADMAHAVAGPVSGPWLRELVGAIFFISWAIASASGVLGAAVALNALSNHAVCTNYLVLASAAAVFLLASVRKFQKIAWLTWAGFLSIFAAAFIVITDTGRLLQSIGVTLRDRPAAAPQTGDFELGYHVIGSPTFAAGISAVAIIFCSGAGTSAFIPVMAEMRRPRDYNRAVYLSMTIVTALYLTFSLVVYRWCGQWMASPALGSAGSGTLKKVAYGVGLVGLLVSACVWAHTAAKYLFVRLLRGSRHLQGGGIVHWAVWLSCTGAVTAVACLFAVAIPIFNYLVALCGSLASAPLAIGLPGYLFLHDDLARQRRRQVVDARRLLAKLAAHSAGGLFGGGRHLRGHPERH